MVGIALGLGRCERGEHPLVQVGVVGAADLGCSVHRFVQQHTDRLECTRIRGHRLRADAHAGVSTDAVVDGQGARTTQVVVGGMAPDPVTGVAAELIGDLEQPLLDVRRREGTEELLVESALVGAAAGRRIRRQPANGGRRLLGQCDRGRPSRGEPGLVTAGRRGRHRDGIFRYRFEFDPQPQVDPAGLALVGPLPLDAVVRRRESRQPAGLDLLDHLLHRPDPGGGERVGLVDTGEAAEAVDHPVRWWFGAAVPFPFQPRRDPGPLECIHSG